MSNVIAYTKMNSPYPGYINFTPNEDGGVTVHLRSDPNMVGGVGAMEGSSASLVLSASEWAALKAEISKA